jgi:hypothetical protein
MTGFPSARPNLTVRIPPRLCKNMIVRRRDASAHPDFAPIRRIRMRHPSAKRQCSLSLRYGVFTQAPPDPADSGWTGAAALELGTAISSSADVGAINARTSNCTVQFRRTLPVGRFVPRFGCSAPSLQPVAPFGAIAATRLPLGYLTDKHHARYARTNSTRCAARSAQLQALRFEDHEGGLVRPEAWRRRQEPAACKRS